MKYNNRCEKHKIFIGKDGCKICNQIQGVIKIGNDHYDWFIQECEKNDKLRKEKAELEKKLQHIEVCNSNNFRHYNDAIKEKNILQQRKDYYKNKVAQLQSPEVPEIVKFATKYLTRNEKQVMINLLGAQSMLAVLVDHFNKIPEKRKEAIKPLYNYVIDICEKVDCLNAEMAEHMAKQIGAKEFENTLTDVASVCDFMAGKITKCKTCTAWLDNKAKNRKVMK